jgi:hypothetical protein
VAHLKARADVLRVWWQAEKDTIRRQSALREQIEQKIESEPAERQDDLNRAAARRYGQGKTPV